MSYNPDSRTVLTPVIGNQFRSAYSEKLKTQIAFPDDSPHTRQEFADECDIKNIMRQYLATGEMFHINEAAPQYMDCSGEDFRDAMDYVAGAFSMFEELPSAIRSQFASVRHRRAAHPDCHPSCACQRVHCNPCRPRRHLAPCRPSAPDPH